MAAAPGRGTAAVLDKGTVGAFFYRNFEEAQQRQRILREWHRHRRPLKEGGLAQVFGDFIEVILYAEADFCLFPSGFSLFGQQLPVSYDMLSEQDKQLLCLMVRARHDWFSKEKQASDTQCQLSGFQLPAADYLPTHRRRLLVRDFVWWLWDWDQQERQFGVATALLKTFQLLMQRHSRDLFLYTVHEGLQGRVRLKEVLCWHLCAQDEHPEERLRGGTTAKRQRH